MSPSRRLARDQEGDAMPHQVVKATVRGSQGDLAKIAKALKDGVGPNHETKINILHIGGGESHEVNGIELGVITMILEPDEPPIDGFILQAIRDVDLDPTGDHHHVAHVETYPNVHISVLDAPGTLSGALDAVAQADLNILSVLTMGSGGGVVDVGLAFEDETTANAARAALSGVNVIVHPAE
jgi:hypothetical protein